MPGTSIAMVTPSSVTITSAGGENADGVVPPSDEKKRFMSRSQGGNGSTSMVVIGSPHEVGFADPPRR
jgi:hypothetical protein